MCINGSNASMQLQGDLNTGITSVISPWLCVRLFSSGAVLRERRSAMITTASLKIRNAVLWVKYFVIKVTHACQMELCVVQEVKSVLKLLL